MEKRNVIEQLMNGQIDKIEAARILRCTERTIRNYVKMVIRGGLEALIDKRGGNHHKLSVKEKLLLLQIKREGRWRSARKAIELTGIKTVGIRQIQKIWVKHNLHRENVERLKPLVRFVAKYPNELWQADI